MILSYTKWMLKPLSEWECLYDQPMVFNEKGNDYIECKLKKSIYELKQTFRQRYLKFNDTIIFFGFKENTVD